MSDIDFQKCWTLLDIIHKAIGVAEAQPIAVAARAELAKIPRVVAAVEKALEVLTPPDAPARGSESEPEPELPLTSRRI